MSHVIYPLIPGPTAHKHDVLWNPSDTSRSSTSQLPHFVYLDRFAPLTSGFGESIGFCSFVAYWPVHRHFVFLELVGFDTLNT